MKNARLFIPILFPVVVFLSSCGGHTVTMETLLEEMVDRDGIAGLPEIPFTLKQFSSYDRGSVSPDQPGWFANSDRTMFIREEENQGRKEYVMMDTEGPGAVVRLWMTFAGNNSGQGILRFYFDGAGEPEIEGTAVDILSGGALVDEPLASSVSDLSPYENRGHNLYLPLPYSRSCRITYESNNITNPGNRGNTGESVYYNINYRTYPEGTPVVTYSREGLEKAGPVIDRVQEMLKERETGIEGEKLSSRKIYASLAPGEHWHAGIQGSAAIRYIRLKVDAGNLPQALRSTVLEAEFDGEKTVWCPAGDFFGTGYQIREINTWYAKVHEDGNMEVFWVMPFEEDARLQITNTGDQMVVINGELGWDDWKWDDRSMHFGVSWRQFTDIFTREGMDRDNPGSPFDLNYADLKGEGVYVGDGLVLFNTSYIWWGEGDEKIFVDGESFPSHFGTGTEDYFGYAWGGRSARFSNHPLIAQPDAAGNASPGYVVNLRYRALDVIPFGKSLKMDMELWHWHSTWVNYAPVAYYYMRPGGSTGHAPDQEGAAAPVALKSTDIISNRMDGGFIEAEHMAFRNTCGNKRGSMGITPFGDVKLSGNLRVMWQDGEPGDSIFFSFVAEEAGTYNLTGVFCAGPDFGTFSCEVNGRELPGRISLEAGVPSVKKLNLGRVRINKGENQVVFRVLPGETGRYLFGLDCLRAS